MAGNRGHHRDGDLSGDGQQLGGQPMLVGQPPQPVRDQTLERLARLQRPGQAPHAVVLGQVAAVQRRLDQLPHDPRVADRGSDELLHRIRRQRPAQHPFGKSFDDVVGQGVDGLTNEQPVLDQVVERCPAGRRPDGEDHEHRPGLDQRDDQCPGEIVQLIGVVDQEEQPVLAGQIGQCRPGPMKHDAPVQLAVQIGSGGNVGRQQVGHRRERH